MSNNEEDSSSLVKSSASAEGLQKIGKDVSKSVGMQLVESISAEQRGQIGDNVGASLVAITSFIKFILTPLVVVVYGMENLQKWLTPKLETQFRSVPPEQLRAPERPGMLVAALDAARCADSEELKDMFARLIAASMTAEKQGRVHPAFVEILKQITPDEARILRFGSVVPIIGLRSIEPKTNGFWDVVVSFGNLGHFAQCDHPDNESAYINNLCRLGLLQIEDSQVLGESANLEYSALANHSLILDSAREIQKAGRMPEVRRRVLHRTPFGDHFCDVCGVVEPDNDKG